MDAFYASVEQRDNPELCGKPLAVGHAEERGVVAAASYEARRYGVHSAMSSQKAKRLCPELIFVPGRMNVYKAVSRQIHDIFHTYTDIIEPLSLDEAFLDVTENKAGFSLAIDIAKDIKKRIRKELGLIASAGVSYNKFRLSGNFWLVSFKISYLCLPLFYETRTTPSCHPSGCAYRQL